MDQIYDVEAYGSFMRIPKGGDVWSLLRHGFARRTHASTMADAIRKKTITRNRDTLTCLQCRAKKLKCDKQLPCGSCVKRNEHSLCSYARKATRKEVVEESRASKAEARLQHLESLVQNVLSAPSSSAASTNSHESKYDLSSSSATYVGATHYAAMLEDIEELRQVMGEDDAQLCDDSPPAQEAIANETDILFGGASRLPMATVLAHHLPPKQEVDRRIAAYFRAEAIAAPFIHVPQFMRQYEQFWAHQMGTSPLWVSILFSICNLSQSTGRGAGVSRAIEQSPYKHTSRNFSLAAANCLVIGRYSRPQRFAVEALGVYIQSKIIETLDPSRDLGILFGTLAQLAYCQGYHRDPSNFPHLTPFEGELRRRAWSYCMQLDLLNSFQLGLPNNIQFGSWNTRTPSNLQDTDFDEDCTSLPPDRPFTDHTKVSFYTAKHLLMTTFDRILRHALSAINPKPEHELVALDNELNEAYNKVPSIFHYRSIQSSLSDPIWLVTTRKCIHLMYQKCRCVLHRPHVALGRLESAQICYEASTASVGAFLELYPEWKPGGQFYDDRWLFGSITWNDFLLGVMVLALVLCQHQKSNVPDLRADQLAQLIDTLKASRDVCLERLDESMGARRTNRLLETLLAQVASPPAAPISTGSQSSIPETQEPAMAMSVMMDPLQQDIDMHDGAAVMPEGFQEWYEPWPNVNSVFDVEEWSFLENCLGDSFDVQGLGASDEKEGLL